jgi:hypothetical protein
MDIFVAHLDFQYVDAGLIQGLFDAEIAHDRQHDFGFFKRPDSSASMAERYTMASR